MHNPVDAECLPDPDRVRRIKPFLDAAPFRAAAAQRRAARAATAAAHGLDPARPWLLAVAMMRPGDKLASYQLLGDALARLDRLGLDGLEWQSLVAGDGSARAEVEAAFDALAPGRVRFLGAMAPDDLPALAAACDLMVWPALNEAYGMALLEAQAAGLPVVAGHSGGVAAVVRDGETGRLTAPGDARAFAEAVRGLLEAPGTRRAMAEAAVAAVAAEHDLSAAAGRLDAVLRRATGP